MINDNDKKKLRNQIFNYLNQFGDKIKTKFMNICGKTGSYGIPLELFQKRTNRSNRALISWKKVHQNNLTLEQLNSFEGGVVVEFVNDDFFNSKAYSQNPLHEILKSKLGSNENVSAIISFRSESGSSSSSFEREYFHQFISNSKIKYNNQEIIINENNFNNYKIKQLIHGQGKGNETWSGFLFVSIKGGQQDTIETHKGKTLTLFNPACEYASKSVCLDIDLVMSYYALLSIDKDSFSIDSYKVQLEELISKTQNVLSKIKYNSISYTGSLLNYCKNHPSVKMHRGKLYDPIQVEQINITDFNFDDKSDPKTLDFTHDEAVFYEKYYWDSEKILFFLLPDQQMYSGLDIYQI